MLVSQGVHFMIFLHWLPPLGMIEYDGVRVILLPAHGQQI